MTTFLSYSTVKKLIIVLVIAALVLIPAGIAYADDGSGSDSSRSSDSSSRSPGESSGSGSSSISGSSSSGSTAGSSSSSGTNSPGESSSSSGRSNRSTRGSITDSSSSSAGSGTSSTGSNSAGSTSIGESTASSAGPCSNTTKAGSSSGDSSDPSKRNKSTTKTGSFASDTSSSKTTSPGNNSIDSSANHSGQKSDADSVNSTESGNSEPEADNDSSSRGFTTGDTDSIKADNKSAAGADSGCSGSIGSGSVQNQSCTGSSAEKSTMPAGTNSDNIHDLSRDVNRDKQNNGSAGQDSEDRPAESSENKEAAESAENAKDNSDQDSADCSATEDADKAADNKQDPVELVIESSEEDQDTDLTGKLGSRTKREKTSYREKDLEFKDEESDLLEKSAEDAEQNNNQDGNEQEAGNSYTAKIDNDTLIIGTDDGQDRNFQITFNEVGEDTIGSARVTIPTGFTLDSGSPTISASEDQSWTANVNNPGQIEVWANSINDYINQGQSLVLGFLATAPADTGIYTFNTEVWQDADHDGSGGIGTTVNNMAAGTNEPFVVMGRSVSTPEEFDGIRDDLGAHYILTDDIDLSGHDNWEPIGRHPAYHDGGRSFAGSFSGNGHTISNLNIDRPEMDSVGLFGDAEGALFRDLVLQDPVVTGDGWVGGLVGYAESSEFIDISIKNADISGNLYVGGLVGGLDTGLIKNSYSTGIVTGSGVDAGGLAGYLLGQGYYGNSEDEGFVGHIWSSYSTADVNGSDNAGGLVGALWGATVENTYATGSVSGDSNVGGLIGLIDYDASVWSSYSVGTVTGSQDTGGLVGGREEGSEVYGSFYDSQTSGQSDDDGRGHPRTTAELQTLTSYTEYTRPWSMTGQDGSYPVLWWQPESELVLPAYKWFMPGTGYLEPGNGDYCPPLIPIYDEYTCSEPTSTTYTTSSHTTSPSSAYTKTDDAPHKTLKPVAEADKKPRALPPTGGISKGLWVALIWIAAGFAVLSFSKRSSLPGTVRVRIHKTW